MSVVDRPTSYRRVLLKISGEAFAGAGENVVDLREIHHLALQVQRIRELGVQLALVIGGGNIIRGAHFSADTTMIKEASAHYMGMLSTIINGLALQDVLEHLGCPSRLMTAIRMDGLAEPFDLRRCVRHLDRGRVVVLGGGTGNPFVTTDTAAALRACELEVDVLLKATRVDGVFNADPERNPHAVLYERLTYRQVLEQHLKVMDMTAIGLCMDNKVPILVFNYTKEGNLERAVAGERVGSYVGV